MPHTEPGPLLALLSPHFCEAAGAEYNSATITYSMPGTIIKEKKIVISFWLKSIPELWVSSALW